ncbi:hypothetical protein HDV00_008973 [Rhizophlyctis rosea]|nr:hypothetical protein HDV00_008973 [Rhizophlyctis rosea]
MPKTHKFELKPVKFKPAVKRDYDMIAEGLPRPSNGGFAFTLLGKRKSGKTNLICSMIIQGGYSKAFDNIIIVSPTVFLDRTYTSLKSLKGAREADIFCTNQVNNDTLAAILEKQKQLFLTDPEHSATLVILDDSGNFLKAKEARNVQSVTMLTSLQLSNTQFWCVWALDGRATKKIANELAFHLTPKQFDQGLKEATKDKYSFLFVDGEAEDDADTFKKNFTEPLLYMSVKLIDQLHQVLEELTKIVEWGNINSEVKQKLLNEIYE